MPYFLQNINSGIIVMGALFLIFFAFINYVLSKVFRDKYGNVNTATAGIISFCIAILIIYFGKDTISNIIDSLRFSDTILYIISVIAVLILLYFFRKKLRFCMILMLTGAGLILIGAFTELVYQKEFVIGLGIGLLLLGIWMCTRRPRNPRPPRGRSLLEKALEPSSEPLKSKSPRGAKRRNVYDLKQKYLAYLFQYYNKGNNPQRKKRIKQAMQTIIKMANKIGYPPRVFLSKKIAGQNAKAPNQLK